MKIGQWAVPFETFWEKFQVIYEGQYSNGIKSGRWNAFFTSHLHNRNEIQIKNWMNLYENNSEQPMYVGKYQDGVKIQEYKYIQQMLYYCIHIIYIKLFYILFEEINLSSQSVFDIKTFAQLN